MWSLLKRTRPLKRAVNKISPNEWYSYFKTLLNDESALPLTPDAHLYDNNDAGIELDQPFSCAEIESAIYKLSNDKSPGPDGIPSEFYKFTLRECIHVLETLFNHIYETGIFPKSWGQSLITTIHKSGSVNDPNNYRGISVTNTLTIFSRLINTRLYTRIYSWA